MFYYIFHIIICIYRPHEYRNQHCASVDTDYSSQSPPNGIVGEMLQLAHLPRGIRHTRLRQSKNLKLNKREDMEFAADVCLVPHKREHIQMKSNTLEDTAKYVGLKIYI